MFDQATFNAMLATKYALLQQNANAETARANAYGLGTAASANLDNVRAGLMPNESAATVAEQAARTAGQLETNRTIGPLAQSQIGLQRKLGQQYGASALNLTSEAQGNDILNHGTAFDQYIAALKSGQLPTYTGLGL